VSVGKAAVTAERTGLKAGFRTGSGPK